jgi:hypothetical protein
MHPRRPLLDSSQLLLCGRRARPDDQVTPHFILLPSFRPPQVGVFTVLLANKLSLYHTRVGRKNQFKEAVPWDHYLTL